MSIQQKTTLIDKRGREWRSCGFWWEHDGWLLDRYTIETDYGPVTVKQPATEDK